MTTIFVIFFFFTAVEGAYLIATVALILVLCLYIKKVWKLYRKRGKRNKSYTPLEVAKTKICKEPVKATYGKLNQNEPGNQETPSTPEIPNPTEQATAPPQGNYQYFLHLIYTYNSINKQLKDCSLYYFQGV